MLVFVRPPFDNISTNWSRKSASFLFKTWINLFLLFALNFRKLQRFLLDQRTTPLDTAIYWTEYVLRHNGAYHLQAPSRNYRYVKRTHTSHFQCCAIHFRIITSQFTTYNLSLLIVSLFFSLSVFSVGHLAETTWTQQFRSVLFIRCDRNIHCNYRYHGLHCAANTTVWRQQ